MNKKRHWLFILLVITLCASLLLAATACINTEEDGNDDDEDKKDLLIPNGDFEYVSSENFPKKPDNWSGSAGATGSNGVEIDEDSLAAGVIDVSSDIYKDNWKKWGKTPNPGKQGEDNNVLMINNKVNTSYKYTVSNVKIETGKYYKISLWVKTTDGALAYVYVNGDAYAEFEKINTNGQWKEFTAYIEGSLIGNKNISIALSNGLYGKKDGKLSEGYAFFDNVFMEEIKADDYNKAKADPSTAVYSMLTPDKEFEYTTGTKLPFSPAKHTGVVSKGEDGESAPTGSDYLEKGILDTQSANLSDLDVSRYAPSPFVESIGYNMLFINAKKPTAYGYRANTQIRFSANKYYKLSIMVRTHIDKDPDGIGATLKLTTGSSEDDLFYNIENINTDGAWVEYSFYIEGHEVRNKDLQIEMWLGKGGKNDLTLVQGAAFFDMLSLTSVDEAKFNEAMAGTVEGEYEAYSLKDDEPNTLAANGDFTTLDGWVEGDYGDDWVKPGKASHGVYDTSAWNPDNGVNPNSPSKLPNIMMIKNSVPTTHKVVMDWTNDPAITNEIVPNHYYRLGVWVKTLGIPEGKGLSATLFTVNKDAKEDDKYEEKRTKLASFDNINTEHADDNQIEQNNGYTELVFMIEGSAALENNQIFIEFALGSGGALSAANHVSGSAFMSTATLQEVKFSEYNGTASGTYVKKHSFSSGSYSVTNGDFINVDTSKTLSTHDLKEIGDLYDDSGKLYDNFGLPKNWSFTNEAVIKNLHTGVTHHASESLNNLLFGQGTLPDDFFKGMPQGINAENNTSSMVISTRPAGGEGNLEQATHPNVCGCDSKKCIEQNFCNGKDCDDDCDCAHKNFSGKVKPWGYTSPSISLSKSSYYRISVWVKTVGDETKASLTLGTTQKNEETGYKDVNTNGEWQRYNFYVATGLSDASAKLDLMLGNKGSDVVAAGTVFFDMANVEKVSEDEYDGAVEAETTVPGTYRIANYSTDSFNAYSETEEGLYTPSGWDGEFTDDEDAPVEEDDNIAGIFNQAHGDWDVFGKEKEDNTKLPEAVRSKLFEEFSYKDMYDPEKELIFSAGDNILAINNKNATAYNYSTKYSNSFAVDSYYEISIWVYTYGLKENEYANITMKLNNRSFAFTNQNGALVNTSTYANGEETAGEWTRYSFFVKTAEKTSIANVSLILGLGMDKEENYVSGYAFFDNLTIAKIDKDRFDAAAPEETFDKAHVHRVVFSEADVADSLKEEDKDGEETDRTAFWLGISGAIIGGLIIIVVAVVLIKKYIKKHPKKPNSGKPQTYSRTANEKSAKVAGTREKFNN